jgi:hypothetical protein
MRNNHTKISDSLGMINKVIKPATNPRKKAMVYGINLDFTTV